MPSRVKPPSPKKKAPQKKKAPPKRQSQPHQSAAGIDLTALQNRLPSRARLSRILPESGVDKYLGTNKDGLPVDGNGNIDLGHVTLDQARKLPPDAQVAWRHLQAAKASMTDNPISALNDAYWGFKTAASHGGNPISNAPTTANKTNDRITNALDGSGSGNQHPIATKRPQSVGVAHLGSVVGNLVNGLAFNPSGDAGTGALDALKNADLHSPIDDLPGPVDLALPNLSDYTGPYDQASGQAMQADAAARPVINQAYDDLTQRLAAHQAQVDQRQQVHSADLINQLAATRGTVGQAYTPPAILAGAPDSVTNQLAAGLGSAQQGVSDSGAANQALMQESAQAQRNLAASNQQGADDGRGLSLANAQENLTNTLNQIGLGKAKATAAYNTDVRGVQQENAQNQRQYALDRYNLIQQSKDNVAKAQYQQQQYDDSLALEQQKLAIQQQNAGGGSSVHDEFVSAIPSLKKKYPKEANVLGDVIDLAGYGPGGRTRAARLLTQMFDDTTDAYAKARNQYGIDPSNARTQNRLQQWVDAYYSQDKSTKWAS